MTRDRCQSGPPMDPDDDQTCVCVKGFLVPRLVRSCTHDCVRDRDDE